MTEWLLRPASKCRVCGDHRALMAGGSDGLCGLCALAEAIAPLGPWVEYAACAEVDPEVWFPAAQNRAGAALAASICAGCDVREECGAYADDNDEQWGVWGGVMRHVRPRPEEDEA